MNPLNEQKARMTAALRGFHEDEGGMEALQVVMIVAIAAVALIVVKTQWTKIKSWFTSESDKAITGW